MTRVLPPTLDEIFAYSATFRCDETFSNYLTYLKVGCMMAGKCTDVFSDKAIKRSKGAIRRRCGFTKRKKMFLQAAVVKRLMVLCDIHDVELRTGILFLVTWAFLLRLPSEALPVRSGSGRVSRLSCIWKVAHCF